MNNVKVIGIGLGLQDLTPRHHQLIESADVLVGGRRLLDLFPETDAEKIPVTREIAALMDMIRQRMMDRQVVVLASGDPLFHGIGAALIRELGAEKVEIHPNITSVAAAFARIKLPWSRVRIISFHGRDALGEIWPELARGRTLALLTDPKHTPSWIAERLLAQGFNSLKVCVLERLGMKEERVRWLTLAQGAEMTFADPNLMVIQPPEKGPRSTGPTAATSLHLGMADEEFRHAGGMITKAEVRAVSLAKLSLERGLTLWDLGAGSGSVGIEAALLLGAGRIVAVEKNPARADQIEVNAARWGVANLTVHRTRLPQGLDALPDPDRVFIGGGGKDLPAILGHAARRLPAGGIIVVNLVILENLTAVLASCEALNLATEFIQLQVQRGSRLPGAGERLAALNPVWIVTAKKFVPNFLIKN